jgi:hypothetical protein
MLQMPATELIEEEEDRFTVQPAHSLALIGRIPPRRT